MRISLDMNRSAHFAPNRAKILTTPRAINISLLTERTRINQWQIPSRRHFQLDTIIRYIQNQEQHHRRRSFKDEYLAWLKKFEIPFEDKYVFQFIE